MTPRPPESGLNGTAVDASTPPLTVRLHRVRLDGARHGDGATLRSAREVIVDREVIIVEVVDADGHIGWGECSALPTPGYTPEYLGGCWSLLRDILVPEVVADPIEALAYLTAFPGHPMARSALIGALIDLDLRAGGRSLATALADGGAPAPQVRSTAVVGMHDDPADLEAAVERALAAGHQSVKLKIDPLHDVVAVQTVRRQWPDLPLAVDANASYGDADEAVAALARIEAVAGSLAYVEQPLAADDLVGATVVARRTSTPVALDESVTSLGEAVTAISLGAVGILNCKPARVGGPLAAIAIARVMVEEGVGVFCGGMVESGIGRAAALAFAAQDVCTLPTDLGPSERYHREDLTRPFVLSEGAIAVPTGPGIGVAPDADVLAAHTIARWQFR
ncbi:MAG TPA: o-succinylbenzoate synthase [Acidimicrobiales bacterium]|nr:o-succinylbenzoate synthase [Acidimicrobiales bacterium]